MDNLASSKPRVLFVDDYADFVDILPLIFASERFQVIAAHSGQEALDLMVSPDLARTFPDGTPMCPFDLAVLDVAMPEVNGPTCALRISKLFPSCPLAFLTGHAEYLDCEPGAEEVVSLGIPVWHKPIEVAELRSKIYDRLKTVFESHV